MLSCPSIQSDQSMLLPLLCGHAAKMPATPFCTLTQDKNTDIQSPSLCITAIPLFVCFALFLTRSGWTVCRRSWPSSLFRWVQESRRPKRGTLVKRESSSACLGKEPEKQQKIRRVETQWGVVMVEVWGWGVCRQAERDRNRVTKRRQRQTGREREAEREEGRTYLKRLCL